MSPVESLSSLPRAPGMKTSASPKDSLMDPSSPPRVLPKDRLDAAITGLPLISPLYLSSPVSSSRMEKDGLQAQPGAVEEEMWASRPLPPPPPRKDSRRPTTPRTPKALPSSPDELAGTSPKSQTSPTSQSQLWRRRSLKSDKNLNLTELKLASTNGSTAATSQQAPTSLAQDLSFSEKPLPPSVGPGRDSPSLEYYESIPDGSLRPSASDTSLRRDPPANLVNNKQPTEEHLDAFAQYAQEVEDGIADGTYEQRPDSSAARPPEIRCPPTPESTKDNDLGVDMATANMSPTTPAFPVTPPSEGRPLSMIPEDFVKNPSSRGRGAMSSPRPPPPSGPLPALPPRSSSRPSPSQRYRAPSPGRSPPGNTSSTSAAIRAATGPAPTPPHTTTTTADGNDAAADDDDDDDYYYHHYHLPSGRYSRLFPPGSTIPAPPLRGTQLDCFAGHALFVPSRNEAHPVGCMACRVEDRGARYTCSHCAARVCGPCCEALVANGRDLRALVKGVRRGG
ncbi:hypothetical protein VPNG_00764 [Cytospora leucostoma]|uniref:Uncharacterized protein n=1 Tax=Cytospora leucostoma TaxID=1230097 RepID=A0A423XMN3_9PEZI|nr:hypothetical protein VPNG_00764 [Cytospora leucostoma]